MKDTTGLQNAESVVPRESRDDQELVQQSRDAHYT